MSDIHVIVTMRSKQDYVLTEINGKKVPQKVGLAPIQRDGMEYEFTTVLDLAMDHNAAASKDRTGLFDREVFKPSKETGIKIMKWLRAGKVVEKPAVPAPVAATTPPLKNVADEFSFPPDGQAALALTPEQIEKIQVRVKRLVELGRTEEVIWKGIRQTIAKVHKKEFAELGELASAEADTVVAYLDSWAEHEIQARAKAGVPSAQAAVGR